MSQQPVPGPDAGLREALERLLRQASRGGGGWGFNADMHEEAVVDAILADPAVRAALDRAPARAEGVDVEAQRAAGDLRELGRHIAEDWNGRIDVDRLARALDLCGIGFIDGHLPSTWATAVSAEYARLAGDSGEGSGR